MRSAKSTGGKYRPENDAARTAALLRFEAFHNTTCQLIIDLLNTAEAIGSRRMGTLSHRDAGRFHTITRKLRTLAEDLTRLP